MRLYVEGASDRVIGLNAGSGAGAAVKPLSPVRCIMKRRVAAKSSVTFKSAVTEPPKLVSAPWSFTLLRGTSRNRSPVPGLFGSVGYVRVR